MSIGEKFPGIRSHASRQNWPVYDEKFLDVEEVEYGVQVNGKVRDRMRVRKEASAAELEGSALATPKVREAIAGRTVSKVDHRERQTRQYRSRQISALLRR